MPPPPLLLPEQPQSGLLQSSVVSLYTTYILWSALSNEPYGPARGGQPLHACTATNTQLCSTVPFPLLLRVHSSLDVWQCLLPRGKRGGGVHCWHYLTLPHGHLPQVSKPPPFSGGNTMLSLALLLMAVWCDLCTYVRTYVLLCLSVCLSVCPAASVPLRAPKYTSYQAATKMRRLWMRWAELSVSKCMLVRACLLVCVSVCMRV